MIGCQLNKLCQHNTPIKDVDILPGPHPTTQLSLLQATREIKFVRERAEINEKFQTRKEQRCKFTINKTIFLGLVCRLSCGHESADASNKLTRVHLNIDYKSSTHSGLSMKI